jgi:hypothetical protein
VDPGGPGVADPDAVREPPGGSPHDR